MRTVARVRRPVSTSLEGPDPVQVPAIGYIAQGPVKLRDRQFIDVVYDEPVTDIEHRVAVIQARNRLVGEVAVSARSACGRGRAAMPRGTAIERVAIGVGGVQQESMAHLPL